MIAEGRTGVESRSLPASSDSFVHDAHHVKLGHEIQGKYEDEDEDNRIEGQRRGRAGPGFYIRQADFPTLKIYRCSGRSGCSGTMTAGGSSAVPRSRSLSTLQVSQQESTGPVGTGGWPDLVRNDICWPDWVAVKSSSDFTFWTSIQRG